MTTRRYSRVAGTSESDESTPLHMPQLSTSSQGVPAMIMNKFSKFSSRSTAVYFCHIAEDILDPGRRDRLQLYGHISKDYKTRGREKHRGVKLEWPSLIVEPRVRALQTSQNVKDIQFLSR